MMDRKIELRRVRDFNAKINATFEFIKQNFKPLFRSLILISGPLLLIQGIFSGLYQRQIHTDGFSTNPFAMFSGQASVWYGMTITFLIPSYVASLIVVNEYMRIYETKDLSRPIEVQEIWESVKTNILTMIGVGILVALLLTVSLVFFILPSIYFSVVLSLLGPIMIIERKSFSQAFSRSFFLISEKWWSTFGLIVVTTIIGGVMAITFAIPQYFFTFLITSHKVANTSSQPALWEQIGIVVSGMIYTIGSNLLQSIVVVAVTFQYYNLVERKEAKGLLSKVEDFGKAEEAKIKLDETY